VLTIAGFDPSGGAGIIVDVRTIVQFGCRPTAATTSLTFQNSDAVFGATHESARSLRAQIIPIVEETQVAAVKVGMLPTTDLILEVASLIREGCLPPPVLDTVLRSSSGYELIERDAVEVLKRELLPLARVITPNIPEAEALTATTISNEEEMLEAAAKLRGMGARGVLIKGGHLKQESGVRSLESEVRYAVDILDDDGEVTMFRGDWIDAPPIRGTGCLLSSAIAACLATGSELKAAVESAKKFVAGEIQNSRFTIQN
jgi:hydroxymethylpyrimidine kinase/phosphomethylpyrimidine kinase